MPLEPSSAGSILNSHQGLFSDSLKKVPSREPFVSAPISEMGLTGRYDKVFYGINNEELYARNQSALSKLGNGVAKATGTFATSFIEGTVGLINGIMEMRNTGRAASFFDNDLTRSLDDFNKYLEDALPNYYTQAELDAEWYAPKNVFSANFVGDKVLKNLGYSFGALAGGAAWTAALRGIGLTGKLVTAGKGLQAIEAAESAMVNAPKLQKLGAINKSLTSLWQGAKGLSGKGLTNTERVLVSAFGTTGEASIEAYHATNEFRQKLIDEYKNIYGAGPTGEALEEINEYSDRVGANVFAGNTALLFATNYIQLPKILGSSKTLEKRAINNIEKEVIKGGEKGAAKWIAGTPTTGNIFSPIVNKLGKPGRFVDKYVLGPGRLGFSASEAFEEGMQYSVQTGVEDYFNRAYQAGTEADELLQSIGDVAGAVLSDGVRKTLTSKEGMESILIGGVSGGIQKIKGNIKERGFFGTGGEVGANTQLAIDALNKTNVEQILKDGKKYIGIAIASQQLRQEAIKNDDTLNEKDYEKDYALSYIMPRVKYGKQESIYQEIDGYKRQAMSDGGFEELQGQEIALPGETKERFIQRLDNIKRSAEEVEKVFNHVNDKYSAITNKEGKLLYTPEVIDKMVYAISKVTDYDQRLQELDVKLGALGVGIKNELTSNQNFKSAKFEEAFKDAKVSDAYNQATAEIEKLDLEKDNVRKDYDDFVDLLVRRQKFIDDYNNLKTSPENFQEEQKKPFEGTTVPPEAGKIIKIKTKKGEIDVEVGEKYRMGRVIGYDKNNNLVYRAPEFVFLGENEDGTLRIRDGKGERNVSKDEFIDYNVGKSSVLEKNKKAKFFHEHWNVLYEHKGLKDQQGKPRKGRLEYDPKSDKMLFVYVDERNRRREVEVIGQQFVAKKGYTTAMVNPLETLTAVQKEAQDAYTSSKEDISVTLQNRKQVVANTVTNSKKRVEEINKELDKASASIEKVDEALKNAMFTKKGLPRKALKNYSKTIDELTKQKEALEKTVESLKDEKSELESQLPYLESLLEYAESLPENYVDAITDMREEVASLKEMVENTEQSIKAGEYIIEKLNDVLKNALSLFNNFVKRLSEENPDLPLYIDVFVDKISKFLGEEGAKNFVEQRLGYTDAVRDLEDQLSEFREELDIPQSTSKLEKLQANVSELKEGLTKLKGELAAKQKLLDTFEELVKQAEQQKAQQELLQKSDEFVNSIFGTMDNSQRTMEYDSSFEQDSKKDNLDVPRATIPSQKLPGYENANTFGNNLNSFENKDKIRAIIVTSKNEEEVGLKGLTKHLAQERDELPKDDPNYIDPTQTIVVVMVEEQPDGSRVLVGVDGKPVGDNPTFENTVYQVMPSEELKWSEEFGGKSMFRKDTPDKVKQDLTKQYKEWRASVISKPPTKTFRIEASFGVPEPVMIKDENGKDTPDDSAMTSVTQAGLVTDSQIATKSLLHIPTTSKLISRGTTKFKNALGRVFLMLPNAFVRLENRRLTKREAELVYKVIERVATRVYEDENAKADDVVRMLRWLKSVVYWGTPKDRNGNKKESAGYNSIWFERGKLDVDGESVSQLVLNMSNKGAKIPFDPLYIRDNKTQIVEALMKMYNNVNSTYAIGSKKVNWNDPYEEIMDVNPDGTLVTRDWPSYQAFLLSDKVPDSKGQLTGKREKEDFPLHVKIRPKESPEDTNRKNVYFVLSDVRYTEPKVEPAPTPEAKPKITKITAGAGAAGVEKQGAPQIKENPEGVIKIDGKSINTFVAPKSDKPTSGMKVKWIYNPKKKGVDAIVVTQGGDLQAVLEYLTKTQGSEDAAKAMLKRTILASIPKNILEADEDFVIDADGNVASADVEYYSETVEEEEEFEEEAPTAPVSDVEANVGYISIGGFLEKDREKVIKNANDVLGADIEKLRNTLTEFFKKNNLSFEEGLAKYDTPEYKKKAENYVKPRTTSEFITNQYGQLIIPESGTESNIHAYISAYKNKNERLEKFKNPQLVKVISTSSVTGKVTKSEPYTAEVKTDLEGAKPAEDPYTEEDLLDDSLDDFDDVHTDELRVALEETDKNFESENWSKVESFLRENFPWLPVYRVKNIIKTTNGLQAWGMLKDGAIYVYENAEVGTLYHEVFEAVWKHFSDPKEQRSIINEFKSRKGTFIDRPTGREIAYKDATAYQIKEQLAEEFRDYVQYKKVPQKPVDGRPFIVKLFSDIVNFIKNFFANTPGAKNNTERLFQKIGTGYYKTYNPFENKLSFAKQGIIDIDDAIATDRDELRLKLSGEITHSIMQELTYMTLTKIVGDKNDLFETELINKNELYRDLKYNLGRTALLKARKARRLLKEGKISKETANDAIGKGIALWRNIKSQWPAIIEKHEEYLRSYAIEFDENDEVNLRSEENTGRGEFDGSDKIDHFRKMNSAVKLLLSTIPMMMDGKLVYSSINGVKLLPLSGVYMTLMNNLHTSRNIDEMVERLKDLAINDENYRRLYYRLTRKSYTDTFSLNDVQDLADVKLLTAIWTTFKKQNPDVKTVFIFESGDVNVGDSNLATAARLVKSQYETGLKVAVRKPNNPYFEYSEKERAYIGKKGSTTAELKTPAEKIRFLNKLGIPFTEEEYNNLSNDKKTTFDDAVNGIRASIAEADRISTVGGKTLEIEGRLMKLALIRAVIDKPEFDSTFFNVKGERTQSFVGTNAISELFDAVNQVNNLSELVGTQYEYILTDSFAKNSVIINRMFNVKLDENGNIVSGERIENIPDYLKSAYADGTVNNQNGKKKQSSKQTYRERLVQEINLNLNGYYLNLVPGDASMEHMAFMGNAISESTLLSGFNRVFKIFEGYFISEVSLARENREIVQDSNNTRSSKDLRFFKGILGEDLHDKIMNDKKKRSPQELYDAYKDQINSAVENFVKKEAEKTKALLEDYEIVKRDEGKIIAQGLGFPANMTEAEYSRQMNALSVNYIVNNIELHKLLYSDPYMYADELKRIKNFLSPRQAILHGSAAMNASLNRVWNQGYSKEDVAHTDMTRDYFRTVVANDILGEHNLEDYVEAAYKETDGSGIMHQKGYRNFRIRAGNWSRLENDQYKYDMAWYKLNRRDRIKKSGRELTDIEKQKYNLSEEEFDILQKGNPSVRSAYTAQKPIVAGNNDSSINNPVLDKFAVYPLSYRIAYEIAPKDENGNVIETNAMRMFDKMMDEDIDYITFPSGRKVGAKNTFDLYDDNGVINPQPFLEATQVPFSIISVQAEMPSKEDEEVTRGSQVTKLVTMDFMEGGVPVDFEDSGKSTEFSNKRYEEWFNLSETEKENRSGLYKEIKNNQRLLEALIEKGYKGLLNRMGIVESSQRINGKVVKSFVIEDMTKVQDTFRSEILKRESNENISESLNGLVKGDVILEATPAYRQIRNILYSIADKQVASQKITGGQKIQIPSTLLETNRIAPKIIKDKKGKSKKIYTSDVLKFYTNKDGERICELMLSRWFDSPLSDDELLDYFNNTEEGRKQLSALTSVAFRIPTQKQNSIERFVIKKFLPREFGDNVVVPAALVQKAGSDFDIDKLSTYLKNMVVGKDGKPRLIRFLTNENSKLEERYVHWVAENSNRDTKRYVKFLTREQVRNLKTRFEIELAKIRTDIRATVTEMSNIFFERMREEIRSERQEKLLDQDAYMKELFEEGAKLFWSLDKKLIDEFLLLKNEIAIKKIKGPQEIQLYMNLANGMLKTRKDLRLGDKTKLTLMVKLYKQELQVLGASEEIVKKIEADALARFREDKKADYKSVMEDAYVDIASLNEMYSQALTEQGFEAAKEIAEMDGLSSIDDFAKMSIYEQNTKSALENGYIESMEALVSHPLNFKQLVKPNSADTLKDLAKDVVEKRGLDSFDYSSTQNMLSRQFMSRLRHAFVSGKYAIGIAAVNQTNHSLNQRQLIYVNNENFDNIPEEDKPWLGDGKIKFKQYNKVRIGKKEFPTLSMVKNAAGEYISDLIGQFIDGYVDIAKGPWIMELGANPNVASTYLFLVKLGVPIKSVVYFMNQPIIRDYLNKIENAGYSWLFIDDMFSETLKSYGNPSTKNVSEIPSEKSLGDMIGKKAKDLTPQQKEQQAFVLGEFVKYAKLASHMFMVTQGSNFDTSNFNDPYLVFKKMTQYEKAQQTLISSYDPSTKSSIPAVEAIVKNSFLKTLASTISDIRNAYAEILKSDRSNIRDVVEPILRDFVDVPDREFVKIAQKVVTDLFDWAVQTDRGFNNYVGKILMGENNSPERILEFVKSIKKGHPLYKNHVIDLLTHTTADNGVNNLSLANRDNKVYDQNQIIYAFSEIRDYLKGKGEEDLYKRIVLTSVLQSGLSSSKISFTSLLPYEDFKEIYNQSLAKLNQLPNLHAYRDLGVFFRNNWNNDDVVGQSIARLISYTNKNGYVEYQYNPAMAWLPESLTKAIDEGKIPQMMSVSSLSQDANSEFISYSWERPMSDFLTKKEMELPYKKRNELWKSKKLEMRKRGNYSYMNKGLFRKVYNGTQPLSYTYKSKGEIKTNYVYKMVNAWGDSFRANEFYDVAKQSVIDNGFLKVNKEVSDDVIGSILLGKDFKKEVKKPVETLEKKSETIRFRSEFGDVIELSDANFEPTPESYEESTESKKVIKPKGRPAIKNKNNKNCG